MKILNFPEYRQTYSYDCGAKSAQSVLTYYGIDVQEGKVMKIAGTTRGGTYIHGITKVMHKYGIKCKVKQMTIEEVKKNINKKRPVILVLQAWKNKKTTKYEKDWKDGHYVVAIGYKKNKIIFEDPSSIERTYLNEDELKKRWHDVDIKGKKYVNYGIICYGRSILFNLKKLIHMG